MTQILKFNKSKFRRAYKSKLEFFSYSVYYIDYSFSFSFLTELKKKGNFVVSLTPYQITAMSNNLKANLLAKQWLFIFKKRTTAKLITKKNLISHNCLS